MVIIYKYDYIYICILSYNIQKLKNQNKKIKFFIYILEEEIDPNEKNAHLKRYLKEIK